MASVLEKLRFWARHVARFDGCGLTRREYCDRHDLVPATLDYWRRRLRTESAPAFVPLQPRVEVTRDVSAIAAVSLELSVGNARLIIPSCVDATWLASLLQLTSPRNHRPWQRQACPCSAKLRCLAIPS